MKAPFLVPTSARTLLISVLSAAVVGQRHQIDVRHE
jgi:hypothetical protein